VVVSAGVPRAAGARELVEAIRRLRPAQPVEVIDLDDRGAEVPAGVVGTPTFLLGKEIVSVGNPCMGLLLDTLDAVEPADGPC
jgi:hypothetical protein